VLQKHEEEHTKRSSAVLLRYVDSHAEEFGDERHLSQAVSFAHSLHLSFAHPSWAIVQVATVFIFSFPALRITCIMLALQEPTQVKDPHAN